MKNRSYRPITTLQFILVISTFQISVAFLTLPRELAAQAGTDGWIAILIGWAIATVAALIIVKVMKYHPDGTILDLLKRYLGAWPAKIAAAVLGAYYFTLAYDGYVITALIIKVWLLPTTYIYILVILMMLPTFQIAQHGLQVIGRYSEMVAMLSIWIPFIYLITLRYAHWLNLLPVLKEGWMPVFSAARSMVSPMLGIALTFFLYPHLTKKERAASAVVISNSFTCAVYLGITIICYLYYSPDGIMEYNNPVIGIMKSVEFKFIERVEIPFIAFYLFVFSCVWIPSMYIVSYCSKWLLGKGTDRGHLAVWCAVIGISIIIYRSGYQDAYRLIRNFNLIGFIMEFAMPVCLLVYLAIYTRIKGRKPI
ncbi:endospore germination permease [Paenibacillus sp. M1]|uniref:Endospore germination permease n=1 Tax=Paenibacillus haidiansis TaxID=1574488 RepID=A0ABU7VVR1_9BACL